MDETSTHPYLTRMITLSLAVASADLSSPIDCQRTPLSTCFALKQAIREFLHPSLSDPMLILGSDRYEPIIQDPVYVGADIGGIYDWDLATTPQTQLDGAARPMPQGKVLGGGSILNAMCWNRGGQDDYNAWAALGNPGWDWEGMLPYFIKSETYTPVYSADIAREYSINYNPLVHGFSGPVQVSYPRYFYPQSTNLFAALNYLGVPTQFDPNDGSSAGAALVPTDLDPNNQTRSDARRTYFDPYVSRPNFHVITGQHVTRVLIEGLGSNYEVSNPTPGGNENGNGMNGVTSNNGFGFGPGGSTPALDNTTTARLLRRQSPSTSNLRITGVEFAASASDSRRTITATREVIVAAGSLHSAQLLQLSGIGPSSLLNTYGIPIALDLPGVGNNLQDHCLVGTFYPYNNASYPSPTELTTNATYNALAEMEYNSFKTGPWTAGSPNALAFNPLPLISNNSASILSGANDQSPTEYLPGGLDPTIIAGYTLQKQSLVRRLAETTVASYEIINNNAGSLTVAVMHPFSRGQCYIHSADPFEPPSIDPRWLTNPVDRQVLIEALLFNRQILATPAMLPLQAAQFVPTVDADEDAINAIINNGIRTEFHPSGTCAMLPLEQGGVVDPHLRVHGTQNLRVVDAGIFPMIPAAHLQAVVYAVAEKAADIIKADNPIHCCTDWINYCINWINCCIFRLGFHDKPDNNLQCFNGITNNFVSIESKSDVYIWCIIFIINRDVVNGNVYHIKLYYLKHCLLYLPSSYSLPSSISYNLPSTYSLPTSVPKDPTQSITLQGGQGQQGQHSQTLSPLETTPIVVSSLPTSLVQVLSTLGIPTAVQTAPGIQITVTPASTVLNPTQLSSSVENALTSGGLPTAAASALVPVIVSNFESTITVPTNLPSAEAAAISKAVHQEQLQLQASIEAFIQWLLHFFHLG
ncbi:MAG: hypothetical protein Q9225_006187 [Loekoesia sp. 1 TL-2023]